MANDGTEALSNMPTSPREPNDGGIEQKLEDDESCWLPLSDDQNSESYPGLESAVSATTGTIPTTVVAAKPAVPDPPPSNNRPSVQVVQQRWETNRQLRKSFVQHPLDQSWGIFARHFIRELWELDFHIRAGILFVVVGALLQLVVLASRWYQPRALVLLVVFLVSFIYLAPPDLESQLRTFLALILDPALLMDNLDAAQLKRLFLASSLVQTLLEMKTFGFLSHAMVDAGWKSNILVASVLMILQVYCRTQEQLPPRACIQRGVLVLYGAALLFSLARADIHRLPALAGPLFLSTGTLLIFYRNDDMSWLTRAVRHALRLTLRDVLAKVGQSVQEDEMLRLAMLRWIVDYWSTSMASTTDTESESASTSTTLPPTTGESEQRVEASASAGLPWDELSPMLDMTTDQMLEEVPSARTEDVAPSMSLSLESTAVTTTSGSLGFAPSQENRSILGLKSMLESMDVDDRAKPAVMAYKHAVQSFPPSHSTAVWLSIARRCPASLVLTYRFLADPTLAFASAPILLSFIVMETFRVLQWSEACQRTQVPTTAPTGESTANANILSLITIPSGMDPMCIFLSGDDFSALRPPTILQVWRNIQSSVSSLEKGLTAARCAHTTVAAADFAGNVMSLAQLGVEVSQKGLGHGLGVLAKELVTLHSSQGAERDRNRSLNSDTRYTNAAVGVLRSGSIVARNVQALSEDEHAHPTLRSVAGAAVFLSGRGWLHGKEDELKDAGDQSGTHTEKPSIEGLVDEDCLGETEARIQPPIHSTLDKNVGIIDNAMSDDFAEIMELIAIASEKELIVEEEKHAFMESLVASRIAGNQEASKATRDGIKKSLDCLFQQASEFEAAGLSYESMGSQAKDDIAQDETSFAVDGDPVVSDRLEIEGNRTSGHVSLLGLSLSPVEKPRHTSLPESSEASCRSDKEISVPLQREQAPSQSVVQQADERSTWTAEEESVTERSDSSGTRTGSRDGDDIGKWVGGGLAVLGAVVGGIALANRPRRQGGDSDLENRSSQEQTVTIEEIDEDSEEWISVPCVKGQVEG